MRKTYLLTRQEIVAAYGVSEAKVRRALKGPKVYAESHSQSRGGVGGVLVKFIDPATLGLGLKVTPSSPAQDESEQASASPAHLACSLENDVSRRGILSAQTDKVALSNPSGDLILRRLRDEQASASPAQIDELTVERHARLQVILRERRGSSARAEAIRNAAVEFAVSERSIRHWVTALEKQANSAYALSRLRRADKGQRRFPDEVRELVTAAFLNNRPGVSANAVYRALVRSVPELMEYSTKGGKPKRIEPWTVRAIQKELEADPAMQLIFRDTTERKEFLRVYNGKVTALHANAQWQMDMTRCDVLVFNPLTGRYYRLRVHAIIDTFSGCIMGIAFSEDEDQAQTNIALLRALTPKTGKFAHLYPIYGTPNTIYWDNGKTYRSGEVGRIVSTLGIQSIHSPPRVSHTRGKIERFFGSMHGMIESTLTGYAGMNAIDRDNEELRVLKERTDRWAATGRDPGRQQRFLTEEEFKSIVLMWVLTEYHQMVQEDGLTRQEKFLESVLGPDYREGKVDRTAPGAHTLRQYDPAELFVTFCRHINRVVTPDSGILYNNRMLKSPTAELAGYAGRSVVLLEDSFSAEGWFGVMYKQLDGTHRILGEVTPAPQWADSAESVAVRLTEKTKRRGMVAHVQAEQARMLRPELNIAESLIRALPEAKDDIPIIDVTPLPLPTSRARLATAERVEDMGNFGKFLDVGADAQTADDFMATIKKILPGRKK